MSSDLLPDVEFDFHRDYPDDHPTIPLDPPYVAVLEPQAIPEGVRALLPENDSAGPDGAQRKEDRADLELREQANFWEAVFRTDIGCKEIWNLIGMGHPIETQFATSPAGFPDQFATFYKKGEQDLATRQFALVERACRDGYWRMRQRHDPRLQKPGKPKRADSGPPS